MKIWIGVVTAVIIALLLFKFAFPALLVFALFVMLVAPFMTSGKGDRDYHNRE